MKLKEQMQRHAKLQGKSPKTFETYWHWCSEFFEYCRVRNGRWIHPKDCGRKEIESWLTWLANDRHVSKNTQNLALQSVLYLYREILGITIEGVKAMRSTKTVTVRDVLDVSELQRLFEHMDGVGLLAAQMMYGCGLRIGDLIALRIKDISFERKQIAVKTAKGDSKGN